MRLSVDVPIVRRGKRFWKTNTSILSEEAFKKRLRQNCAVWRQQRKFYPDWPLWWGRYTKTDSSFLYSGKVRLAYFRPITLLNRDYKILVRFIAY